MATYHQQSGGQKTFRLARLFHTEDCYRARALTAEELVRRTFIGVDAATFEDLRRQGSYVDVTSCESWHRLFDDRFQDVPTCGDIASAVERLGFLVERSYRKDWDHFNFGGVRLLSDYGYFVQARCDGCECRCDHGAENTGTGCESCDCACDGCYCAAGCAASHPDVVDDTEDPLMNLTATDANRSHRSRRFTLASGWHSSDCKVIRSFTAEELVKLTFELNEFSLDKFYDWHQNFKGYFEGLPSARELADALMRQGIHLTKPSSDPYDFDGTCFPGLSVKAFREAFWIPRHYRCGDQPCDCLCELCGPTGCAECDCTCEGCFCSGTCAEGHPVVQRDSDSSLSLLWRTLAADRDAKRFQRAWASWHAESCTTVRWLSADQIALMMLTRVDFESEYEPGAPRVVWCQKPARDSDTRCGFYWVNERLADPNGGPSCTELADAVRRTGSRAQPISKRWPWERTHYALIGVNNEYSRQLMSEPSCTGCECFCPLCDDCSRCRCECTGCMCSARCLTGDCIIVRAVPSETQRPISEVEQRLGTKRNMSEGDLQVSNALVSLEKEVGLTQHSDVESSGDTPPTFELSAKGDWHRDGCEHPRLTVTADELLYVTLRPISDDIIRSHERYGVELSHTDCESWIDEHLGLLSSEPTCEQLAVAAERLGYQVKPVEGFRQYRSYDVEARVWRTHVTDERQVHYGFLNAAHDRRLMGRINNTSVGRFWASGGFESLDKERCFGRCKCNCTAHFFLRPLCECAGCYCEVTCDPAFARSGRWVL